MWGESSKNCEVNCQCSGLITENFKINSGNSATKRKQEEALSNNYRLKIHPHTLDFNRKQSPLSSPMCTPSKRRVLGEIQNSPLFRPKDSPTIERLKKTPISKQKSPIIIEHLSPLTSRSEKCKRIKVSKIARILEERSRYRMANKENDLNMSDAFLKMDDEQGYSLTRSKTYHKMDNEKSYSLKRSKTCLKMDNEETHSLTWSETYLKMDGEESHSMTRSAMFLKIDNAENNLLTRPKVCVKMDDEESHTMTRSEMFLKTDNAESNLLTRSQTCLKMDAEESNSLTQSKMYPKIDDEESNSLTQSKMYFKRDNREIESLSFCKRSHTETKRSRDSVKRSNMFSTLNNAGNESLMSETFVKLDVEEDTRDCSFVDTFPGTSATTSNWCKAKLDFTDALQSKSFETDDETKNIDMYVPEKDENIDADFETLHDLEEEFGCTSFDECSKYEIISTDSPNIISSGRSTSRKIHSTNFEFGAPLLENEKSTSFNKPNINATRMLNFDDENFEFTSPAVKKHSVSVKKSLKFTEKHNISVKKTLKFTETPTKTVLRHERSDSSIGSMSMSPKTESTKLRIYPSDSTLSMESGFISELEDQFLDFEVSNSPKMANFKELLSGQIKDSFTGNKLLTDKMKNTFEENQLLCDKIQDDFEQKQLKENSDKLFNVSRQIMHGFEESPLFSGEVKRTFEENQLLSEEVTHTFEENQLLCDKIQGDFEQKQLRDNSDKLFNVSRQIMHGFEESPLFSEKAKRTFGENQLSSKELTHTFGENQLLSEEVTHTFGENQLFSGKVKNCFGDNQLFSEVKDTFREIQLFSEVKNTYGENQLFSEEVKNSFEENQLFSGETKQRLVEKQVNVRRPLQKSLSFNPEGSRARISLFSIRENENQEKKNNKRNERTDLENISSKRRRSNCQSPEVEKPVRPVLQRAFSENHASIMSAMTRFETEPGLIGDFTLPFALPLTSGEHADLSSISCDTLAGLLRGDFVDSINEFQVIDCRYPYEFEGGHIAGAVNLYTPELVLSLVEQPRCGGPGRSILVFHCEFSRERGPKLSRFLRSKDRLKNKENYPSLHYPEVYLLHEGYRAFYQRYPELCSPLGYTAMLDPDHRVALKKHRSFSQTSTSSNRRNRFLL
ncbi:uncharacterized protein [Maniola hyperantus]|uniref:uncharacterized protein isoform X2 n=1 Tax=Aphantopus hyperantus TaxID=2795564 RepID=UPI0037491113